MRKMTIEPAKHLGLGDLVGSLEIGKQADIIIVDRKKASMVPLAKDPIATLVYNANGNDVSFVMVAGEILVQDYELVSANEKEILEDGQAVSNEIYEKYLERR